MKVDENLHAKTAAMLTYHASAADSEMLSDAR